MTRRRLPRYLFLLAVVPAWGTPMILPATDAPDAPARMRWARAHPELRIAIDPQLGAEVQGGQGGSLFTRFVALAAQRNGVRLTTVRTTSWKASVEAFDAHAVDLLPSMSDRLLATDVGKRALLSSPFYVGHTVIIARTAGPLTLDMWALRGRTVAFKGGGAYETWLQREHPTVKALPLADIHQVLAAVESGIADAAVGIDATYLPLVRRDYAASLRVAGNAPDMPVTLRLAVQHDDPELLSMIEASLAGLSPREHEAVIDKWLETAYLRAPTLTQVMAVYRVEIVAGIGMFVLLVFALWQLRRAQLASRRSERQKTLLLAVMSHEVRNAVNAVTSSIELLATQPLDEPQRDLLALAQAGSRNLQGLLRSALDFSRAESEGFTPDLAACDVYDLVRGILAAHVPGIEAKGLRARLDLPTGPLPWLLLDAVRLRQVVENLLANAVRYTESGHVGIALWQSVPAADDSVRRLIVDVFDTGPGVAPEAMDRLFRPFGQARGQLDVRMGGTGLGLLISRDIVRNLGGTLDFNSTVGEGTQVRIDLPTSLVPPMPDPDGFDAPGGVGATPKQALDAGGQAQASRGRVLLVEDHPSNRRVIAAQLAALGYGVDAVGTGAAALARFRAGGFMAVLLDIDLPDMSGYEVASAFRKAEAAAHWPPARLVAVSGHDDESHRQRCTDAGMDVVVGKPLSLDALREALEPSVALDIRDEFLREARRDLAAMRAALAAGHLGDAARSMHRLHGAALICGMASVAAQVESIQAASDRGDVDPAALDKLREAIEKATLV